MIDIFLLFYRYAYRFYFHVQIHTNARYCTNLFLNMGTYTLVAPIVFWIFLLFWRVGTTLRYKDIGEPVILQHSKSFCRYLIIRIFKYFDIKEFFSYFRHLFLYGKLGTHVPGLLVYFNHRSNVIFMIFALSLTVAKT